MKTYIHRVRCDACGTSVEAPENSKLENWIALRIENQDLDFCPMHAQDVREAYNLRIAKINEVLRDQNERWRTAEGRNPKHPEDSHFCTCGIYNVDEGPSVPDPRTSWRHQSYCPHSTGYTERKARKEQKDQKCSSLDCSNERAKDSNFCAQHSTVEGAKSVRIF